jgi:DNA-binding transcriptional regulator YdaS (Cro superfamily)
MEQLINEAIEYFGSVEALAKAMDVSPKTVYAIRAGIRKLSHKAGAKLDRASNGKFSRKVLFEDWREVWPELDTDSRRKIPDRRPTRRTKVQP